MTLWKSIKILGLAAFITLVVLFFSIWSNLPEIVNVIIFDVFILFAFVFLMSYIFTVDQEQNKYSKKSSIYQWMDELQDTDNYLLRVLKDSHLSNKTIDNLSRVKDLVERLTKREKKILRLYKAFYTQRSKESAEEIYLKSVLGFFPAIGLYFVRDYIPELENSNGNTLFLTTAFLFLTMVIISDKLSYNKRRYGLLVEIIDICIEEIDDEEKKLNGK